MQWLQAQPGQGLSARSSISGALKAGLDVRLGLRRQILPHDGMVDDGCARFAWFLQSRSDPVSGVGPLNSWTISARQGDGAFQPRQALVLIGPNIGPEAKALSRVLEIDRGPVASQTLDHPHRGFERRRRSFPARRDAHGALPVAP